MPKTMGRHCAWLVRAAVAASNAVVGKKADCVHECFLRMKSDGKHGRLIVNGTMRGHPNALNSRLPRPTAPPAMMSIGVVIIVMLAGEYIGVDDISTAFPQHELCGVMQRALGWAVITEAGARLSGNWTRVIQGGSWSATQQQYCTLMCAAVRPPRTERRDVNRETLYEPGMVDYVALCVRKRRLVHVDDVMNSGRDPKELDAKRLEYRRMATEKYRIKWKDFEPATHQKRCVGVLIDARAKTWRLVDEWVDQVCEAIARCGTDVPIGSAEHDWLMGVAVWVQQVAHVPGIIVHLLRHRVPDAVRVMKTVMMSAMTHTQLRQPELMLVRWPREGCTRRWIVSDAMENGWAGGVGGRLLKSGRWHWCEKSRCMSPMKCCGAEHAVEPRLMYLAEAMASVQTYIGAEDDGVEDDTLVATDSMIWKDVLVKGSTADAGLMRCLVVMWLWATRQVAAVHVPGEINVMDAPSRGQPNVVVPREPVYGDVSEPVWTKIGVVRLCPPARRQMWHEMRDGVPCGWRTAVDARMESAGQQCVAGCRHVSH